MIWVFVFGGIALAGVVMMVCYGVWLAHKTADLLSEASVLADRLGELGELVAQIQPPAAAGDVRLDDRPIPTDHRVGSEHQT